VLPPLDPSTGYLPPGRHVCTVAEVEAAFVQDGRFATSATRSDLWNDWNDALSLLQSAVTVHAAWIGGSFTTSKVDPGDIDVTYIVNGGVVRSLQGAQETKIVNIFNTTGRVRSEFNLNVDTYLVFWECVPAPLPPGMNGFQDQYYWARGYWDDWWQRARCQGGPKGGPPVPADTVPRRGYLEVPVSDYIT
jgi:hypothetical protein